MHYADGQPAKIGDLIITDDFGAQIAGILTAATSQSCTCNGYMHVIAKRTKSELGLGNWMPIVGSNDSWSVTLSKAVAVDFKDLSELTPGPAAPALQQVAVAEPQAAVQEQTEPKVVPIAELKLDTRLPAGIRISLNVAEIIPQSAHECVTGAGRFKDCLTRDGLIAT